MGDPQKRSEYDQLREAEKRGFGFSDIGDIFSRGGSGRRTGGSGFEDFGGLGDLFSRIFDRGERVRSSRHGPTRGSDVTIELDVPFEKTISGWDIDREEIIKTGQRINTMKLAFNIREGINMPFQYPDRMLGKPAKTVGPRAGVTMELPDLYEEYYQAMGWDTETGKPSKKILKELGMDFVAKELYK